ncbi:hypothetical protein CC78DRAFT_575643 [Lojkania enalia]|uniref:Uncharacterized protein n=1 Tax=Lojkania enalia TaxID=147567 RepID=A0A9P4KJJ1_9PLEO|nr:hypothetical protein CC78DRAFT_575643 [Didymosphaeria enalia]
MFITIAFICASAHSPPHLESGVCSQAAFGIRPQALFPARSTFSRQQFTQQAQTSSGQPDRSKAHRRRSTLPLPPPRSLAAGSLTHTLLFVLSLSPSQSSASATNNRA